MYLWSKEWKEEELKEAVPPPVVNPPPEISAVAFEPVASTSACGQTAVDDVDLHPALKLPLSALEIEHLATTMAQSIPNSGRQTIQIL